MESKIRELSAEYYKRKSHLYKARMVFLLILFSSVAVLVLLSVSEKWALHVLFSYDFSNFLSIFFLFCIFVYLLLYNILLSRIALRICYHFDNKKIPSLIIMLLFGLTYFFLSANSNEFKNILSLAVSKLAIISLYFNFWNSQLNETRLKTRSKLTPFVYLISFHAFFICRWVLIACWLLSCLGFVLALVSSHPVIHLDGWEGFILIFIFYILFRLFVRNPNAHANY